MGKCPCCDGEIAKVGRASTNHLVIAKTPEEGGPHVHVHGDIQNKVEMKELLENAAEEIGIPLGSGKLDRKEVVLRNRQRIGDMLMFTCAVRDFKLAFPDVRVNVVATAMHLFDHNPHIDRSLVPTAENTIMIGPGKLTNASNRIDWHFANAYRVSIEDALHVHIPQGESRPDIWLTQEEYDAPRLWPEPYWIICVNGEKGWGCKMYPFQYWQKFVDMNPDIKFVQIGTKEDNPPRLQGKNVIDWVGQTQGKETGIRDLFKLFLNAEGSIGLVSFHMHLSGALKKPCIVVAGAREPVSFTRYAGHKYMETEGALPCAINACWHCDIKTCTNLIKQEGREDTPKCVDMITPEDLTRALDQYYTGGRLLRGTASAKPKFKNIVPTPALTIREIPESLKTEETKWGMSFGGGSLTSRDWEFIKDTIVRVGAKTILEFGAGLSTLLLNDLPGVKVITYETNQGWINKVKKINPACEIRLFENEPVFDGSDPESFDLVFVDGPSGDKARNRTTEIASKLGKVIIVHDAGREWARKYQEQYLKPSFKGPGKGGHRCHLWEKQDGIDIPTVKAEPVLRAKDATLSLQPSHETLNAPLVNSEQKNGKFIKIVSTARGWGGCARSVTTIMKMLLNSGYIVEFIPFRNKVSSREFQECIKNELSGLIVTENYSTLNEACDVLLVYADDYVWEFKTPAMVEAFSDLNAARKIMMLNYRRGPVGEVEWTKGWDKYMFLNSNQEKELLRILPGIKTRVLPPCTELASFLTAPPNYNTSLRIVRHSSQGDTKFAKDFQKEVDAILKTREDVTIQLMPGPSFVNSNSRLIKVSRGVGLEVPQFLSLGNLFWYSLPKDYMDMGPRVILEAMAAGLPILADNWGGAVDRVTPDCGWLCDTKEQMAEIIKNVTVEELRQKGQAARARALKEFVPENWIKELIGE